MAELKVDLTVRKTVWFYLLKLSFFIRLFWMVKFLEGKPLANLYVNGKFNSSLKFKLSEYIK